MEVFNIGPFEFLIILVIMFVLLGPEEMKRTARRIAIAIRKFVSSPIWADITGMREEIRELPKRLMEDTGLDEAVQEIKQTTTAASDEMNAAVKESVEAARVREVENLRIMTSQKLSPNAGQVIMPPRKQPDAIEGEAAGEVVEADTGSDNGAAADHAADADADAVAVADAVADAVAYTLEVDIEPVTREPAQDQPVADVVNTIVPPAEVVKKPRRKKADIELAEASTAGEDAPAPKPRRAARKKPETENPPAPGTNGSAADESTPAKDETNEPNAA